MNPDDVEKILGSPLLPWQRALVESIDRDNPQVVITETPRRAGRTAILKAVTKAMPSIVIGEVSDGAWQTIGYTTDEGVNAHTTSETRETVTSNLTAYLIRSTNPELELANRWAQTLVLPLAVPDNDALGRGEAAAVYTRTTNGSKGRGNSWVQEGPDENVVTKIADHRVIGTVALVLSDAEAEALALNDVKALATRIAHQPLTASPADIADALTDFRLLAWAQIEAARAAARAEEEAEVRANAEIVADLDEEADEMPLLRESMSEPDTWVNPPVRTEGPRVHAVSVEVPQGPDIDSYVGRQITDAMTDFAVFDLAAEMDLNVLLVGDTGAGKTLAVRAWAAKHNRPCYVIPGNGPLDPSALFGRFIPDPLTGTFEWIDGPVTAMVREGGVVVVDEVNIISAKVLSVLYPMLDTRRQIALMDHSGEVIHAHKDLMVFATMNEGMGYTGTSPLSQAIKNRFTILRWGYDPEVEKKLVTSRTLLTFAERVRGLHQAGEVETPTTTNSLMTFERIARKTGNLSLAIETLLNRYASDGTERAAVKVVFDGLRANVESELRPVVTARTVTAPTARVSPRLRLKPGAKINVIPGDGPFVATVSAEDVWTDDAATDDEVVF